MRVPRSVPSLLLIIITMFPEFVSIAPWNQGLPKQNTKSTDRNPVPKFVILLATNAATSCTAFTLIYANDDVTIVDSPSLSRFPRNKRNAPFATAAEQGIPNEITESSQKTGSPFSKIVEQTFCRNLRCAHDYYDRCKGGVFT